MLVLAFAAMAFRQSPGLIVPDTKLDLTANPGDFLLRALHLWDDRGAFGQLQNQAYGYLFPMGPFHLVLSWLGLPEWVIQRLWWTTIFTVALGGMWLLTRAFGVTNPWARLAGAAAYAASPRIISEIAVTSIEIWPMAVAPWVLLPLALEHRSRRWRVTRSALAFACIGGVNAVATGAALVLPALWLATRAWDRRLLTLSAAWLGAIVVVSAWWLVPLLLLGRHSPPFLDWIESAAITTSTASPFQALRGTSAWLTFLSGPGGPSWPAGWLYVVSPILIIGTTMIAGLGLVGLAAGAVRHRAFLGLAVVTGLALGTLGHASEGDWPFTEAIRAVLDGPLAAMRNIHKFELVVRVPLVLGFAAFVQLGSQWVARVGTGRALPRAAYSTLVASLVVLVAAPAVGGSMARPEGYRSIPEHWRQAAAWLDAQPTAGSVYISPAASVSDLTWGSTKDEPFQALLRRPFVVRDAVPFGSAGATRMLDSMEDRLSEGQRVDGLESVLARSGIAFVLVRNELRLDAQSSPPAATTRALEESGLTRVAGFGPPAGAFGESTDLTFDHRAQIQRQSIEIYAVRGTSAARLVEGDTLARSIGGPENLLQAAAALGPRDLVLGSDTIPEELATGTLSVLTDGRRHREVNFGRAAKNRSALLEAGDTGRVERRTIDIDSDPGAPRTVLSWQGVHSVTASSSGSDAGATLRAGPANGPQAALDGQPRTRWISGTYGKGVGEWLHVDFTGPTNVTGTRAEFSAAAPIGADPVLVRVETQTGETTARVLAGPPVNLPTPPGETSWIRLTLVEVEGRVENGFSIAELTIPGVSAGPTATMPGATSPDAILLEEGIRGRSECLARADRTWCSPFFGSEAEESGWRRQWTTRTGGTYALAGDVRPVDGLPLEKLLALPSRWAASASSRLVAAPAGRPDAAIDADLSTGWVAGREDAAPWYEVSLPSHRRVTGVQVVKPYELPASAPVELHVTFSDGTQVTVRTDDTGRATFPPVRTTSVRLSFGETRLLENIDTRTGARSFAPVGFSELVIEGAEDLRMPLNGSLPTGVPCGFGPGMTINGEILLTSVRGTIDDVLTGRPLDWTVCGGGTHQLPSGRVLLEAAPSAEFTPRRLDLVKDDVVPVGSSQNLDVSRRDPAHLRVPVPERSKGSVLVVAQNYNSAWQAQDANGTRLEAVRVNGWQQGWVLPAGGATHVTADFVPDALYRTGMIGGLLLLIGFALLAWRTPRRPTDIPARPQPAGAIALVAACLVVLGGGWPGAGAVLASIVLLALRRGRGRGWLVPVTVVATTTAAAIAVSLLRWPQHQTGSVSWPVQTLVLLAVSVVVLGSRRFTLGRPRTRAMSGRSTK